ncbi:MAG: HAMP domain-containing histidine kinase [Acidimicrobiia bacterium]|nr:HAMP domain-containing histidine kinase [Acidimicrobiia bacterium]
MTVVDPPTPGQGILRRGTVRGRTTAGAVAVVGIALAVASVALVALLSRSLTSAVEDAARLRAREVVAALEAMEGEPRFSVSDPEEQFIQVVDDAGQVVASSGNVAGRALVADLAAGRSAVVRVGLDDDDARFLVVVETAGSATGPWRVLVGGGLEDVAESAAALARLLAVGAPLLLAVVAVTTWWVVGRALAPVEAMRRQVDAISPAELRRRVPEPGHGDEISRLAHTMNRMLDRLESAQLRQHRFVSDASHELRSPVAAIRQQAEVAAAHPGRVAVPALSAAVLAESLRLQHLLDDLLILARADEGSSPSPHRPVDLDDLVIEEARRIRATSQLRVDTAGVSAGQVDGDGFMLERMVANLAGNAARHGRSRIGFELAQVDGLVTLVVEDDGTGIAPADRERIFDRFVRLDEARTRWHGGAGLGLAIVAEVVAEHGGTVAVGESPSGGARFEVRLPASAG